MHAAGKGMIYGNMKRVMPSSLRDQLYESLMSGILTNQFSPGEELKIDHLAEEFGVSSTPVREALVRLESMGLVILTPNRGAQVSPISISDVKDIWEVRKLLEPLAARHAARVCNEQEVMAVCAKLKHVLLHSEELNLYIESDMEIHELLYKNLDNQLFFSILDRLNKQYLRLRYSSWMNIGSSKPEGVKKTTGEHLEIVQALLERDEERVYAAVLKHLVASEARTLGALSEKHD